MRYRALFAIAWITRIIALLLIIALVLGSCIVAVIAAAGSGLAAETGVDAFSGAMGGLLIFVLGILYAVLVGLPLLALAELIFLFLDIERNTRETVELLRRGGQTGIS